MVFAHLEKEKREREAQERAAARERGEKPARPRNKFDEKSEYENRLDLKEAALTACVAQHRALFECYKRGCWGFSRCCGEEHDAFWKCYTEKRGVNKTIVGHKVETWWQALGFTAQRSKRPDIMRQMYSNSPPSKAPDD